MTSAEQCFADANHAYREMVVEGATPVGLVVLLYDRALEDVRNALAALAANNAEQRSKHVNHALLVLRQLQGSLDFEAGGTTAQQLDRYYSVLRAKLLEAQIRQSPELLQQQITLLSKVRDAWSQVDRQETAKSSQAAEALTAPQNSGEGERRVQWSA